ncbi:type IX secretion system membrane protein PorP/SprF [Flammeovirgaceae bacterium SG7u.111]|nr:type IX secretion system membrane protein PorP/SprF [Flammeovirgaceae bacterium SG7u.132]WPO33552.1 type IX secretion system membrane protein PorP/SprF [Flammeovirgaceae bacterium SG7u.111]
MGKLIKNLLSLLAFLTITNLAFGQQQLIYSQYMFNGLVINPAYAGTHEALSVTGTYRHQWAGFEGAPNSQTISAHSPIPRKRIALGMTIFNENVAFTKQLGMQLAYAYRIPLKDGILSLGIQGGFLDYREDHSQLNLFNPNDPNFTGEDVKVFMPSFGTGLYYLSNKFFLGFSIPQLAIYNNNDEAVDIKQVRQYLLTAGYIMDINNDIKFQPSVLIRGREGEPMSFDINGTLIFNEVFRFGLSYRHNTSLNFLTQLQITNKLQMGYAYDLSTNNIGEVSSGSHEIMLNYRFDILRGIGNIPSKFF